MQQPPSLFDRTALQRHRARSANRDAEAWFLHAEAASLVSERLEEVNRAFTNIAVVGWKPEIWAEVLGPEAGYIADDDLLDLAEGSCDLIIHAMALHWANDPVGQLVQMRRALKPDGLMIAVFFGGQTLHQLRASLAEAESAVEGGISPRVAPMGDIRELGGLLQRAGFALPVADHFEFNVSYETPLHLMHDLRAMGETNALAARRRTVMRRETLARAMSAYQTHFSDAEERVMATFDLCFLTGWAPSGDQQKPLRPGSAQARLAEALGTVEKNPERDGA
jgi:SAM-dependent methyltransferase